VLAPQSDIKLTRPQVFAYSCPTSWLPEQLTSMGMKTLCHCHFMCQIIRPCQTLHREMAIH